MLTRPVAVAVGPGGDQVYVVGSGDATYGLNGVGVFARDAATGAVTPASCTSDNGGDGDVGSEGLCTDGDAPTGGVCSETPGMSSASDVAVTPDGRSVLVVTNDARWGKLVEYAREPQTGALTREQCLMHLGPQGHDDDLLFGCEAARALYGTRSVAVSADGRTVFTASGGAVAAFARDPVTGHLNQIGCGDGAYVSCAPTRGLDGFGPAAVAASPDGRSAYVISSGLQSLTAFSVSVAIASRSVTAQAGAIRVRLVCPAARAAGCAGRVSAGGAARRYSIRAGASGRVVVALPRTARAALRAVRRIRLTVVARDSSGALGAVSRKLEIRRAG